MAVVREGIWRICKASDEKWRLSFWHPQNIFCFAIAGGLAVAFKYNIR